MVSSDEILDAKENSSHASDSKVQDPSPQQTQPKYSMEYLKSLKKAKLIELCSTNQIKVATNMKKAAIVKRIYDCLHPDFGFEEKVNEAMAKLRSAFSNTAPLH